MLTVSDVVAAKLLVQLEAVPFEVARAHLRAVAADEAATDDLVARLQAAGALPGATAARARRLVALYELVRAEAVYLQHLEREGLAREQAHALLAEIEASPVRERLGAVLVAQDRLTAEDDARLLDKTARSLAVEDERVVGRYLRDDFEGVARPVVPGAGADVRPEHVRLSALFRSPRTQKLVASEVRRRLREAAFDPFADAVGALPAAAPWTGLLPELPPGEPPPLADPARAARAGTARLRAPQASSRVLAATPPAADPAPSRRAPVEGRAPRVEEAQTEAATAGGAARGAPPPAGAAEDALAVRAEVGPYRVVECLGRGGAGAVYLAEDVEAGGLVAVKVQHAGAATPDDVARFRREAAHLRRVDHPHVVHLIDEGTTDDGLAYLVLPAFPGRSLRVALREGPWAPAQALALLDGLLDALAALHAVGLVHRDVKPENVFVVAGRALEIRLLDLGIARPAAPPPGSAEDDAFRTRAGVISGSPAYVAPETITDEPIDGRTDLYSVGVLLFEVLTGGLPLTAATPYELLREHLVGVPRTLAQARPEVAWHPELEGLVARLLAKEPALRPSSASALRDELRGGLGGRLLAPPTAAAEPTGGGLLNGFFRRLGAR